METECFVFDILLAMSMCVPFLTGDSIPKSNLILGDINTMDGVIFCNNGEIYLGHIPLCPLLFSFLSVLNHVPFSFP